MAILQRSFMLRTSDGVVEKVSIEEKFLDCAPYVSKSGLTFNGCFQLKRGELVPVRGLFRIFNEPLYRFSSRAKFTRELDVMKDFSLRFVREFSMSNALIYYDNYSVHVYDSFRRPVMLEDTPWAAQGHLFIYQLKVPIDLDDQLTTEENIFGHKVEFTKSVKAMWDALDGLYISPGTGFLVQTAEDVVVKISSPDHGEEEVSLPAGQYLFLHSPPRKNED